MYKPTCDLTVNIPHAPSRFPKPCLLTAKGVPKVATKQKASLEFRV